MFHADNAYALGAARIVSHRLKTHTVSNTAFRGFGGPQGMMAIERAMDAIAIALARDPLDVRKANLYRPGHTASPYGQAVDDGIAPRLVEALEHSCDYRARRAAITAFNQANPWVKRGLSLTPVKFGISFTATHLNQAGALVHVYTDGSVLLNHGGTEMGQGLMTKVAQVAATAFALPLEQDPRLLDPHRQGAQHQRHRRLLGRRPQRHGGARRLQSDQGPAGRLRGQGIRGRSGPHRLHRGGVQVGDETMAFSELVRRAYFARISLSATGYYRTPKIHYDRAKHQGRPFFYYAWGAACSEVIVDVLTGEHRTLRVDILHDCGSSLNPAIDAGQIEGGFVQGMGWLTTEELVFDDAGRLRTHAPSTYKIPACSDRPPIFNIAFWDEPNREQTIHRSKAVGEPPLMLAISVFSALTDAVASVGAHRHMPNLDAPATPERVLFAIEDVRSSRAAS
jgi:xanthine dehydrogenase large subunit